MRDDGGKVKEPKERKRGGDRSSRNPVMRAKTGRVMGGVGGPKEEENKVRRKEERRAGTLATVAVAGSRWCSEER